MEQNAPAPEAIVAAMAASKGSISSWDVGEGKEKVGERVNIFEG